MDYKGTIIEESLANRDILKLVRITGTRVEKVTSEHKTPWLERWTLDQVEIPEGEARGVAAAIGRAIDPKHAGAWFADFKNESIHFIIFKDKVFEIHRKNKEEYEEVKAYGLSIGIPEYQLDFQPNLEVL